LVHSNDRCALKERLDGALAQQGERISIEYRLRRDDGDLRVVHNYFEVVFSQAHLADKVIGTIQDVTDLRKTERELHFLRTRHWHADRISRTGVLVASLAHELSQPLAAILSNAQAALQLLTSGPADANEIQEIFRDIVADDNRASELINALRAMIRHKQTERTRIDVGEVVKEVLKLLHAELVAQQVNVTLDCMTGCHIVADRTQLAQVTLNLIANAIEAMQGQPAGHRHLAIQVHRVAQRDVVVKLRDSGIGIPKKQIKEVFDAFWTMKEQGVGIGLAVCRSIVEAHGGRIWVVRNRDRGVCFSFQLPMAS
jgi:C4-dicarboxylate-specific signal transduction histidine kinase